MREWEEEAPPGRLARSAPLRVTAPWASDARVPRPLRSRRRLRRLHSWKTTRARRVEAIERLWDSSWTRQAQSRTSRGELPAQLYFPLSPRFFSQARLPRRRHQTRQRRAGQRASVSRSISSPRVPRHRRFLRRRRFLRHHRILRQLSSPTPTSSPPFPRASTPILLMACAR